MQALLELNVQDIVAVKTLSFAELKSAPHLAINPMGTSPAFSDGEDVKIWESGAILTHILEAYDQRHMLHPPPGSSCRMQFLQLQSFLIATIYPFVAGLYLHTLKPTAEQDHDFVAAGKKKWADKLGPVLAGALGDKMYLLGEFSAVDLLLAKPLRNADALGLLSDFPTLQQHLRRLADRPSYAVAYAVEGKAWSGRVAQ